MVSNIWILMLLLLIQYMVKEDSGPSLWSRIFGSNEKDKKSSLNEAEELDAQKVVSSWEIDSWCLLQHQIKSQMKNLKILLLTFEDE